MGEEVELTEQDDWIRLASERQVGYNDTLGSRPYDEIEKSNIFLLKKKVGFATCGKPHQLPNCSNYFTGYTKEELDQIQKIIDKIIEKSDSKSDNVRFACTVLILYHKGEVCETPVFRIITDTGNIFIDAIARVYTDWENFVKNNKLPDCKYCSPSNGEYTGKTPVKFEINFSPASKFVSKATDCLDTAGSVASVAAAGVFALSVFVTVAPVVATVAGTTAACAGAYSITRSAGALLDRKSHEQSVGLKDRESRSAWLNIGSSAVGVATVAAIGKAQKIIESGKSLGKLGVFGLHTLTASSLVFSGFGFVESLIICTDKYQKGILTPQDVFDLSCELLFLFNAIASVNATRKLVNNMAVAAENASSQQTQKKLTKTQKRNLRKRAAKRRAKGISAKIIESDQSSNGQFSTALKIILFEAIKSYAPRVQEIMYICQSIGHDVLCWKENKIGDLQLLNNLGRNLLRLYNDYKDDIDEAIKKIVKFFSSVVNEINNYLFALFQSCNEEGKSIFCTKLITVEDKLDTMISNGANDIAEIHERLEIESIENEFDRNTNDGDDDDTEDDDLSLEAKQLISRCEDIISTSSWRVDDINDFTEIMDGVSCIVVDKFNEKVASYKKSLEAAKCSCESLNINRFHETYGIKGDDICQHFFNETVENLTAKSPIYDIKLKCNDLRKERNTRTTPVWEGLTKGVFHYYGPHGTGPLAKPALISVVSEIVKKTITEEACTLLEEASKEVIMIKPNDDPDIHIVIYCGITKENTASGVIMIINSSNNN